MSLVLALLHTERPLTADELWDQIPGYSRIDNLAAFRRAFERDKDLLRTQGLPLSVESVPADDGPVDGYRLDRKQYYLDMTPLGPDELGALRLAMDLVGLTDTDSDLDGGLLRLGGLVDPGSVDGLTETALAATPVAGINVDPVAAQLMRAASAGDVVSFAYRGEQRTIDVWGVAMTSGHWYLSGRDHLRDAKRLFRVDRIEGDITTVAAGAGAPPPDAHRIGPDPPWLFAVDPEVEATVRFDAVVAGFAAGETAGYATAHWEPDGSVTLTMAVTSYDGFRWFVLGWLDHCEVIAPQMLRDVVADWVGASHE